MSSVAHATAHAHAHASHATRARTRDDDGEDIHHGDDDARDARDDDEDDRARGDGGDVRHETTPRARARGVVRVSDWVFSVRDECRAHWARKRRRGRGV